MGLLEEGHAAAWQEREANALRRFEAREKLREKYAQKVANLAGSGFTTEFLGFASEPQPERLNGQLTWHDHVVYRFQVDDVVLRFWEHWRDGTQFSVEVPCKCCGRNTSPEEAKEFAHYRSNLVELVGEAVSHEWTCAHCAADPVYCSECGRSM